MHPEICQFPSLHFYEGKLLNGHDAAKKSAPFHKSMFLGPYVFIDVTDGHEQRGTGLGGLSISNKAEADVVIEVLRFLKKRSVLHPQQKNIQIYNNGMPFWP